MTITMFERVITSSIDGIFTCDASFNITVWNPGMEFITGVTREDAVDRPLLEVFPRLEETGDHASLQEAMAGETTIAKESSYSLGDGDRPVFFEIHFSSAQKRRGRTSRRRSVFPEHHGTQARRAGLEGPLHKRSAYQPL